MQLQPGLEPQVRSVIYDLLVELWPRGAQVLADLGVHEDLLGPTLLAEAIFITIGARHDILTQYRMYGEYVIFHALSPLTSDQQSLISQVTGESVSAGRHIDDWLMKVIGRRSPDDIDNFLRAFFTALLVLAKEDETNFWPTLPRQLRFMEEAATRRSGSS